MKSFDVHFNVYFSDMLPGIEAETKEEAIGKAKEMLDQVLQGRIDYLISCGDQDGFELQFTDTLEIGKEI